MKVIFAVTFIMINHDLGASTKWCRYSPKNMLPCV